MAVTSIYYAEGWGASFSGTLNLPQEMSNAVAQVTINAVQNIAPGGWCQVFFTGYSANGNPVLLDNAAVLLTIANADSFDFAGGTLNSDGFVHASIMAFGFE